MLSQNCLPKGGTNLVALRHISHSEYPAAGGRGTYTLANLKMHLEFDNYVIN